MDKAIKKLEELARAIPSALEETYYWSAPDERADGGLEAEGLDTARFASLLDKPWCAHDGCGETDVTAWIDEDCGLLVKAWVRKSDWWNIDLVSAEVEEEAEADAQAWIDQGFECFYRLGEMRFLTKELWVSPALEKERLKNKSRQGLEGKGDEQ